MMIELFPTPGSVHSQLLALLGEDEDSLSREIPVRVRVDSDIATVMYERTKRVDAQRFLEILTAATDEDK